MFTARVQQRFTSFVCWYLPGISLSLAILNSHWLTKMTGLYGGAVWTPQVGLYGRRNDRQSNEYGEYRCISRISSPQYTADTAETATVVLKTQSVRTFTVRNNSLYTLNLREIDLMNI